MQPSGKTCWRNLRRNSMASSVVVRGRALPTLREVQVTVRSLRPTMRRLEMATVKTYGARYLQAVWPLGLAWLWTFQGMCQTCGSMCSGSPAVRISCVHMAREMGERACTGTKKLALEGNHAERSSERPPPGTMEWMWGWY